MSNASRLLFSSLAVLCLGFVPVQAQQDNSSNSRKAQSTEELLETGRALFEAFAPEEIKQKYQIPTKAQLDSFLLRLNKALQGNSMADLAALEPELRQAVEFLDEWEETAHIADWLRERLDLAEAARDITRGYKPSVRPGASQTPAPSQYREPAPAPAAAPARTLSAPTRPSSSAPATSSGAGKQIAKAQSPTPPKTGSSSTRTTQTQPKPATSLATTQLNVPHYDYWYAKLQGRTAPARAASLAPICRKSFISEKTPAELLWLAEVESTFNPAASNPSGALGLYQLMPVTAKSLGLSVSFPDERKDPTRSSQAAAKLLRTLHGKFGNWPLAIAAYNAGEGRVRRSLQAKQGAKSFGEISPQLSVETQLYVPKVLATVAHRTGVGPEGIVAPKK